MPLVIVGVLLLLAKLAEFGPFGTWPWWVVLAPFLGAILWWQFADSTGWTQRRAIDKMERRKAERREKAMDALGLNRRREKQITRARRDAARRTSHVDPTHVDTQPPDEQRREPRL
jgi:small Trp-rich protein